LLGKGVLLHKRVWLSLVRWDEGENRDPPQVAEHKPAGEFAKACFVRLIYAGEIASEDDISASWAKDKGIGSNQCGKQGPDPDRSGQHP